MSPFIAYILIDNAAHSRARTKAAAVTLRTRIERLVARVLPGAAQRP